MTDSLYLIVMSRRRQGRKGQSFWCSIFGCSLLAAQQALTLPGFAVGAQAQGAVDTAGTILGQLDTLQGTLDTISRDLPGARGLRTMIEMLSLINTVT